MLSGRLGALDGAALIACGVAVLILALFLARLIPPPGSLTVKSADLEIGEVQRAPFQDYLPVRGEVAPLHTVFVGARSKAGRWRA